jgi:hypothetical protein
MRPTRLIDVDGGPGLAAIPLPILYFVPSFLPKMLRHQHPGWIHVAGSVPDLSVLLSRRLDELTDQIPEPERQCPGLLLLLGGRAKSTALNTLLSASSDANRRGCNDIRLHLAASSVFSEGPVLIAEGDLLDPRRLDNSCGKPDLRGCTKINLPQLCNGHDPSTKADLANLIYSRLLHPFTNVVCIFLADFPKLDDAVHRLTTWLDHCPASTLSQTTFPHLLLVTETGEQGRSREIGETFSQLLTKETGKPTHDCFSGISTVDLKRGELSVRSRHRPLKEKLYNLSDKVRLARVQEPFNFIRASRIHNPVSSNLSSHLTEFLQGYNAPSNVVVSATSIISSALLQDHYVPQMHRKLPPLGAPALTWYVLTVAQGFAHRMCFVCCTARPASQRLAIVY